MHLYLMLLAAILFSPFAYADDIEPEDAIKYRKTVMTAIKGHNLAIKSIVNGNVPFKNQLSNHINALENLFQELDHIFPDGSDLGKTEVKSAIWDQPERFAKTIKKAKQAMATFKEIANTGTDSEVASAFKKFSKASCGSCHKPFRKKSKK